MNDFYHVYNRGVNRQTLFYSDEEYRQFSGLMRKYLPGSDVELHTYSLMPNHVHMILCQHAFLAVAKFMKHVCEEYARAFNKRHGRVGHAFQGRYKRVVVDKEEYLRHLSRYIHLNPVHAQLVGAAGDWEHSSYPAYMNGGDQNFLTTDLILSVAGGKEAYLQYVDEKRPAYGEELERYLIDKELL
jgi:REP element-mobilizing transposase RayT